MARRIYSIKIAIALGLGFYLFTIRDTHSKAYLITISAIIFTLFSMGVHGLLAHSLKPKVKGDIIIYSLLMGYYGLFCSFCLCSYFCRFSARISCCSYS
ncbi:hypothetical protein [Maribacter sp. 1_MG-2023]|uniref:hypothetical protein n=1 Tax=Maribacter sp. 1_MG-2023 TaxID=3062677 RepID=UPI0026E2B556|nr:hypothetical protein [Maribacter sp. 1_MG-2023]MDO6472566.1 hypothetical protein [Maribacter sp. 1_MG-2023]